MRILVRTAGLLGKYLPPGPVRNRAEIDVPRGSTISDLMTRLGLPEASYLVTLNGMAVPAAERGTRELSQDDNLALMPPLKGG